ncbi:Alkyltransferase-like protein 1 [Coniosporium apollinis]|uniref:Alkyltransferase-like protein 1 n=1 Tax=Coniosporium apollinis TaxID=61459 RepID=A0ABQ9NS98_9PEZI|nr:Alkyltransferase-like protein 1 [Coniosporium apollinis]
MARTEEAAAWFAAVYRAVQEIPPGRVTSYGHIARLLGRPASGSRWHDGNVPWQRVINAKGGISPRGPGGASRQAAALRQEGVTVDEGNLGEFSVDFQTYGWFPDVLPSEEGEDSEEDE